MKMSISEIKVRKRFRHGTGDLESLQKDIQENGLLQPIVVDADRTLIAGLRRLKSCKALHWEKIPITVINRDADPKACEISENTQRTNFTISEIAEIAEYVEKTRIGHRPKKGGNLPPFSPKPGKTRDVVADITGVSPRQAQKIKDIYTAANEKPKKFQALLDDVDSKKKSVNTAHNELMFATKKFQKVKIPKGQYNVLEFDFPYGYKDAAGSSCRAASKTRYLTIQPQDILQKEVPKFKESIAKDAVLFMWVTVPLLNEVIQLKILEGLGFKYKTMISWHKLIPKSSFGGRGMGHWFTGEMEHCMVGVRGNIKPFKCKLPNFIEAPITKDSEKPKAFKELIEEATKNIPNRRMFEAYQRTSRNGWTGYGNELSSVATQK